MWDNLLVIMQEMLIIYQDLLTVAQEKKAVLIEVRVPQLKDLTKIETELLSKANKLETLRKKEINVLIEKKILLPEENGLKHIIHKAQEENIEPLYSVAKELAEVLVCLTNTNTINNRLLNKSIELVNFTLNMLHQVEAPTTYSPQKGSADGTARKMLNYKA